MYIASIDIFGLAVLGFKVFSSLLILVVGLNDGISVSKNYLK